MEAYFMTIIASSSTPANTPRRCAIYARYSSPMQQETSIDDQILSCREYAAAQGWIVVEMYIRADEAKSGGTREGRDELNQLLIAATHRPRPFDVLLMSDTSRLTRNELDGLKIVYDLRYIDVACVFVSEEIDTSTPAGMEAYKAKALRDADQISEMGHRVRKAMVGRMDRGYVAGPRCYGYRSV